MENVVSFPNYLTGVLCSSYPKYYEQLPIIGFNASFGFLMAIMFFYWQLCISMANR